MSAPSTSPPACEACGWAAAFCAALAFGSFGVPIKSRAARQVDIDPLVFQSYKTFVCFSTTWLFLFGLNIFGGVHKKDLFTFSPWGIVSGLFWVPGGVATVFAVKQAGLAIGIGIGSSFIVLVSFVWGIFIFHERVHSKYGACFAILCMMTGLLGMSYYSAPVEQEHDPSVAAIAGSEDDDDDDDDDVQTVSAVQRNAIGHDDTGLEVEPIVTPRRHGRLQYLGLSTSENDQSDGTEAVADANESNSLRSTSRCRVESDVEDSPPGKSESDTNLRSGALSFETNTRLEDVTRRSPLTDSVVFCGYKFNRRRMGMLSALFCGVWGGSITAPMAWAPPDARGTHYLLSFAVGASLVNLALWVFRFLWYLYLYQGCLSSAFGRLPSFHLRVMWLPGGTSGLLWSIGNLFSLVSVASLGEGVGYPLVQTSILISGLWGLFYFNEVTGVERRTKWFASSLLTIFGILLLSYEHHES